MKKITLWGVSAVTGLMFLAAPIAAGAVSIEDLQSQVASLLKQIAAIQGTTSTVVSSSASVSSPVQYRICNVLNRNLSVGSRGDDVSGLQEFLQGQGFLAVNPTGYFGPITSQAVARWQASQGVSSVGVFGPLSRSRLMNWCGGNGGSSGGTVSNGLLQASPQNGQSPLTVTFTTSIGINDSIPSVDFGDGNVSAMTKGSCIAIMAIQGGQGGIRCSASVTHTYTSNGNYTATLVNSSQRSDVGISVGSSSQGSLSANPQNGAAPLAVNFTYLPTSENGTYHIDYGDGSSEQMSAQQIQCIKAPCINPAISSHTYTSAGTYDVVVSPYVACLYSNPRCMIAVMMLAKTTVTVTGTGNQTFTATPQSGPAPLTVTFSNWVSPFHVNTTSYKIDYSDGSSEDAASCNAPADACISAGINKHTYTTNGTYTAALNEITNTCPAGAQCFVGPITKTIAKLQITVGSSCKPITYMPILCPNGQAAQPQHDAFGCLTGYQCAPAGTAPVISSFSGPTTLSVGQTGTWTINASDPANGNLSYSVDWGDQASAVPMAAMSANAFVQTTTFTHSYANAGTYTVTMNVRNASNQTAQTTATVQVGGSSVVCTADYSPVCGQPQGPTCTTGMMCPMYMFAPKTYSNMCQLNAAGATFLYNGACTNGL